jgi:flagellar protein FlaG
LPAEETVRPSTEANDGRRAADNQRNEQSLFETVSPKLERRNTVDPESNSVIYTATNTDTGEVVRQVPSETLRRLRAYTQTIETQSSPTSTQSIQRTA